MVGDRAAGKGPAGSAPDAGGAGYPARRQDQEAAVVEKQACFAWRGASSD